MKSNVRSFIINVMSLSEFSNVNMFALLRFITCEKIRVCIIFGSEVTAKLVYKGFNWNRFDLSLSSEQYLGTGANKRFQACQGYFR